MSDGRRRPEARSEQIPPGRAGSNGPAPETAEQLLRTGAWRDIGLPDRAQRVPTMLTLEERKLLYALARNGSRATGRIVDAGCFLGGSTIALAQGLRDAGRTGPSIDVYDRFAAESYTMAEGWFDGTGLHEGDSFLQLFRQNLAGFEDLLALHVGDIAVERFDSPIELLFLDVLKSWKINDAVVPQAFARLVPGAVIVQQDYGSGLLPWLVITMEHLARYLEPVEDVATSAVFLVTEPIPEQLLRARTRWDLTPAEALRLLDRAITRANGARQGMLSVAKAHLLFTEADIKAALQLLDQIEREYAESPEVLEAAQRLRTVTNVGGLCSGRGLIGATGLTLALGARRVLTARRWARRHRR